MSSPSLTHPESATAFDRQLHRLAIVGMGPKGLFAWERLVHCAAANHPDRPLHVVIYEPHPTPGAGPIYDPDQPPQLRMNLANHCVNVWPDADGSEDDHPSLMDFLRTHHPDLADEDGYPSRAVVGEYLREGFRRVMRSVPKRWRVELRAERVQTIARAGELWTVSTESDERSFDSVLLTVGHQHTDPDPDARKWRRHADGERVRFGGGVFPVTETLTEDAVPPGDAVGSRGFALTFIDAALTLTEGRGGVFSPNENHSFTYHRSGREPSRIVPFSRSGRPMLAKPTMKTSRMDGQSDDLWDAGRDTIRSRVGRGEPVLTAIREVLFAVAAHRWIFPWDRSHALDLSNPHPALSDWWIFERDGSESELSVREQLADSVAISTGRKPLDLTHAVGYSWVGLYPAIVDAVSHGGLTEAEFDPFYTLCHRMERIAFGPPVENVRRLLALVEADVIATDWLPSPQIKTVPQGYRLTNAAGDQITVPTLIDARIPSPRLAITADPLLAGLHASGFVREMPGHPGLEIDRDGAAIGANGTPTPGLFVLGRPTEGCVLGNDTLSRALHPHPDRWADRFLRSFEAEHIEM